MRWLWVGMFMTLATMPALASDVLLTDADQQARVDETVSMGVKVLCEGTCQDTYVRAVFYKAGRFEDYGQIFGYTLANDGSWTDTSYWFNPETEITNLYKISANQFESGVWSGTIKGKGETDSNAWRLYGPGGYNIRVGIYVGQTDTKPDWSKELVIQMDDILPTPTREPEPTITPTRMPNQPTSFPTTPSPKAIGPTKIVSSPTKGVNLPDPSPTNGGSQAPTVSTMPAVTDSQVLGSEVEKYDDMTIKHVDRSWVYVIAIVLAVGIIVVGVVVY